MTSVVVVLLVVVPTVAAFLQGWLRFQRQRDAVRGWLNKQTPTGSKQRLDDNF